MTEITETTSVAEVVKVCATARKTFDKHALKWCGGANGPMESLDLFAAVHEVDADALVRELNAESQKSSPQGYAYH